MNRWNKTPGLWDTDESLVALLLVAVLATFASAVWPGVWPAFLSWFTIHAHSAVAWAGRA